MKVRAVLRVSIDVPAVIEIDTQELARWAHDESDPPLGWIPASDDVLEFLKSDGETEALFPIADPRIHDVADAEIIEVEFEWKGWENEC